MCTIPAPDLRLNENSLVDGIVLVLVLVMVRRPSVECLADYGVPLFVIASFIIRERPQTVEA